MNDTIISNVDQRKLLNYWFPMVLSKIMLFAHSNVWADELHFSIECNVKILDKILLTFETKRHHSARSPIMHCNQMKQWQIRAFQIGTIHPCSLRGCKTSSLSKQEVRKIRKWWSIDYQNSISGPLSYKTINHLIGKSFLFSQYQSVKRVTYFHKYQLQFCDS